MINFAAMQLQDGFELVSQLPDSLTSNTNVQHRRVKIHEKGKHINHSLFINQNS
jgi:hypothetical protein